MVKFFAGYKGNFCIIAQYDVIIVIQFDNLNEGISPKRVFNPVKKTTNIITLLAKITGKLRLWNFGSIEFIETA